MAKALRVQPTLITLILQGKADLSPEQAEELNDHFHHSEDEAEYFRLSVQKERAGTAKLRGRIQTKMASLKASQQPIRNSIRDTANVSPADAAIYYASSFLPLLHMAATLEKQFDPAKLGYALTIPEDRIRQGLEFLVKAGLLVPKAGGFVAGSSNVHLSRGEPLLRQHHINFRNLAMRRLESTKEEDLHFSSAFTVSQEDAKKIRQMLLDQLASISSVVKESKDEKVLVLSFDFFDVI